MVSQVKIRFYWACLSNKIFLKKISNWKSVKIYSFDFQTFKKNIYSILGICFEYYHSLKLNLGTNKVNLWGF